MYHAGEAQFLDALPSQEPIVLVTLSYFALTPINFFPTLRLCLTLICNPYTPFDLFWHTLPNFDTFWPYQKCHKCQIVMNVKMLKTQNVKNVNNVKVTRLIKKNPERMQKTKKIQKTNVKKIQPTVRYHKKCKSE